MSIDIAGQKAVPVDEISEDGFIPLKIEKDDNSITIHWKDGWVSKYSSSWLLRYGYDRKDKQGVSEIITWKKNDMGSGIPTVDYQDILRDDKYTLQWCENLYKYGACLIKNLPCEENEIIKAMNQISIIQPTMYGETFFVREVVDAINVAYTNIKLDIHQDLCYYENAPALQMLHCLEFKASGGDSILADGFQIANDFKQKYPDYFRLLADHKMTYEKIGVDHHKRNKQSIIVEKNNQVVGINLSPPFEGPLDLDFDLVQDYYKAYSAFSKFAKSEEYVIRFKLSEGDLLSFNNSRVFHGRDSYTSEPRTLQGAYMSYTDFLCKYRVLLKKHNNISPEQQIPLPHYRVE